MSELNFDSIEKFHIENTGKEHQPAIILYTPNTYHYTLLNLHNLEKYLYIIHQKNGIGTAEISEDVFGIVPVLNYHKNPDPVNKLLDRILSLEEKSGLKNLSIGTGADIYSIMRAFGGYFNGTESKRAKNLQFFLNFIKIAEYMGISKINGHRVATIYPERFKSIKLRQFALMLGNEKLNLAGLNPETEITGAEAKNLELAIMLQKSSKTVSSSTELMYQQGMEPCTIEQVKRFLAILQANSNKPVVAHMDTGHVVVYGKDKTAIDYDIMAYTNIKFPRWVVHFNALYKNEHRMPTEKNIEKDLTARNEKPDLKLSPHPELYNNVYDWLSETVNNSRIVQVSPEPKPENLTKLIAEIGECWLILKKEYKSTHTPHPKYNGLLIPNKLHSKFVKNFG
ncbi:hypothetical protein ACFL4Z_01050 [candidate division KSB1 bacterium]